MFIPKNMEVTDLNVISAFIERNSFGLIVNSQLDATYLPFTLKLEEGEELYLYAHIARANLQWKKLESEKTMVAFTGPHAYISPYAYQAKPAVPTWNYAAVHCYGAPELLSEKETARSMDELVAKYEPALLDDDKTMPQAYKARLTKAVVGFRIRVAEIHAKEKLGQHRNLNDIVGVYNYLKGGADSDGQRLADYMVKRGVVPHP